MLNPTQKVLSIMRLHRVKALLMGGQACIFYGAAEFSRDSDFAILASPENLRRLQNALKELQANCIAVPPLNLNYLKRGHAIHFRCQHSEVKDFRIDIMAILRGVSSFPILWNRRTTITTPEGEIYDLLSLPDLVQAKKTQRDRDWPMLRRLLESHYFENQKKPTQQQIRFWMCELRTPELLIEVVNTYPIILKKLLPKRPLLKHVLDRQESLLIDALEEEAKCERELDRIYWAPLKKELEIMRHKF